MNLRILVCPSCLDRPQMQFRQYPLPPDPVPVLDPRPDPYAGNAGLIADSFWNDGGVLAFVNSTAALYWPTSPIGLLPNAVWNNGLTVGIVPGGEFDPLAPSLYYPISPAALLSTNAAGLPSSLGPGSIGTMQLWNNEGTACIA